MRLIPFVQKLDSVYFPLMEIETDLTTLPATKRADLHLHSHESDGRYSPSELVHRAADGGLELIALTDHDTVSGLAAAREAARERDLYFVNGLELEATLQDPDGSFFAIHILGYGMDPTNQDLLDILTRIREKRIQRARQIHFHLEKLDIIIPFEKIEDYSEGESLSRVHVAQVLKDFGYVDSMNEAFDRYLGNDRPAYVPRMGPGPEELIMLIHHAGGHAIWAHPYYTERDEYIEYLVAAGIDGIECSHSEFSDDITRQYRQIAREYDLFITGGSDYHGTLEEEFDLGEWWVEIEEVPFEIAVSPEEGG